MPATRLRPLYLCWLVALTGCMHLPDPGLEPDTLPVLPAATALTGNTTLTRADLLTLPDELRASLDQLVLPLPNPDQRMRAMLDVLFSRDMHHLTYENSVTRTATETWEAGKGNCLSLSALIVSAARYVGLHARFQDVSLSPTWNRVGSVFFMERHINVLITDLPGDSDFVVDLLPVPQANQPYATIISDDSAFAQFLNNRASELLADGNDALAYRYFQQALSADPALPFVWANLGILYGRAHMQEAAELSYLQALSLNPGEYTALLNLGHLYKAQGKTEEANRLERAAARVRGRNPYYLAQAASESLQREDLEQAEAQIKRSLRLKSDDPQLHELAAEIFHRLGREREAQAHAAQARSAGAVDPI